MPPKNSIKVLAADKFYHVYNRGVAKRKIFKNHNDYLTFLRLLKEYLLPPDHPDLIYLQALNPRRHPINCHGQIELHAYCLMPNHFHLLVKNLVKNGMPRFIRALATNYSMNFNWKYRRVGPLFQGVYKSVMVETDEQLMHLSRYLHLNPEEIISRNQSLQDYEYSSYKNYLGHYGQDWLITKGILTYFGDKTPHQNYQKFVEKSADKFDLISEHIIEDNYEDN